MDFGINVYFKPAFPTKVLMTEEAFVICYAINHAIIDLFRRYGKYEYRIIIDDIQDVKGGNERNNDFRINFKMGC